MPILAPIYTLFVKGVVLDGKAGREDVRQRFVAEKFISQEMRRRRGGKLKAGGGKG